MKRSTARWTTAVAAAALLAAPAAGFAQTPAGSPAQPPTSSQQPATPAQPQEGQVDADAAKQHLTAARNALSEMTQLPAASQLTGDARMQVSQLITNFNELISTRTDWRGPYSKVQENLNALIGSATADESAARTTGTEGAIGTSGAVALDAEIKSKLVEFRSHLDKFEQTAGGAGSPAASTAAQAGAAHPHAGMPAGHAQSPESAQAPQIDRDEILRHVRAIEAILNVEGTAGTTGTTEPPTGTTQAGITLSAAQVDQLRSHLSELKRLLEKQ